MRQESCGIARWPVYTALVTVLVLVGAAALGAFLILHELGTRITPAGAPLPARREIQTIEQTLIATRAEGIEERRQARRHLDRYEWIDAAEGQVRIPIRRAMAIVAGEVR